MVPNHQPVILWGNQLAKIDRLKVGLDNGTIISQAGACVYTYCIQPTKNMRRKEFKQ